MSRRVAILLVGWNIRDVFLDTLRACAVEAELLEQYGHRSLLVVCDNGSDDGTPDALRAAARLASARLLLNERNEGVGRARNRMLDVALDWGADHVLLLDGDIEPIRGSVLGLLRLLEAAPREVGSAWPDPEAFATERERVTPEATDLDGLPQERVDYRVFTGYGLFRRAVFEAGARFDEADPFLGPGHGFEDLDFAFQVRAAGFVSRRVDGLVFLHRYPNSSLDVMRRKGVDGRAVARRRKDYMLRKWDGHPAVAGEPLEFLRGILVP